MKIKNKFIIKIFTIIYKRWLWNDFFQDYDTIIIVKGWRKFLVETKTSRMTISPCIFRLK